MVDVNTVVFRLLQLSRSLLDALSESDLSHNTVLQAELLAAIDMLTQLNDPVKRSACEYETTLPGRQEPVQSCQLRSANQFIKTYLRHGTWPLAV